jgi:acyl-CoA thioesterase-1
MTARLINSATLTLLLLFWGAVGIANTRTNILVLGDSISAAYGIQREEGWVALLDKRLEAKQFAWQVVNASVSGETTSGGLARLPAALATHDPEVVVIELGGNDGLRGYPIPQVRANLEALVEIAKSEDRRVLLIGMQIPPNYGPRYTSAFARMYHEVADAWDVQLVPFLLRGVALQPQLMQDDGIHPSAAAQPTLLENVWPTLRVLLGG